MKVILFLLIFVSNLVLAQSPKSEKLNVIQKKCVPVKRTSIGFKEVLSDSVLKESDVLGKLMEYLFMMVKKL
jgi:hypothetical protein